jgi:hypothetical protein
MADQKADQKAEKKAAYWVVQKVALKAACLDDLKAALMADSTAACLAG